jgi:hypothetical protein
MSREDRKRKKEAGQGRRQGKGGHLKKEENKNRRASFSKPGWRQRGQVKSFHLQCASIADTFVN